MAGSVALNEGDCDSSGWLYRVLASVQLSRPQRDRRRMGDRKGLHEHGSHVTSPIKPRFTEETLLYPWLIMSLSLVSMAVGYLNALLGL